MPPLRFLPRRSLSSSAGWVLGFCLAGGTLTQAATLIFDAATSGHSRRQGPNITETGTTFVTGEGGGGLEYRGFVSINISALTDPITSAQLRLRVQAYNNGATSAAFRLFDYTSGATPDSVSGGDSLARFTDLGSGVQYGSASITSAANPANSFLTIDLTSDAVAAINSGSGVYFVNSQRYFTIGLADMNISGSDSFNVRMFSGTGTGINQLVVQTVPEPASAAFLGCGLAFAGTGRWRRRRTG